jgi:hypothetical protein
MKRSIFLVTTLTIAIILLFTNCNKQSQSINKDGSLENSIENQKAGIIIKGVGKLEKVVTKKLVKLENCNYIVEGIIEYRLNGNVVATVDYGDGTCDNLATKTVDGVSFEFELDKKDNGWGYEKVIIEPLVKTENCPYIVSGIIQFFKKGVLVATIDYGNGICDEWATKTWNGGSKVFSLKK